MPTDYLSLVVLRLCFLLHLTCTFECFDSDFNPYPAGHDYCRFQYVQLADQITFIENEMCFQT